MCVGSWMLLLPRFRSFLGKSLYLGLGSMMRFSAGIVSSVTHLYVALTDRLHVLMQAWKWKLLMPGCSRGMTLPMIPWWFIRSYVCRTTLIHREQLFVELYLQVFRQLVHYNGCKIARPQWETSVKCIFQRQNDALPVRESNLGSAAFRSLSKLSTS